MKQKTTSLFSLCLFAFFTGISTIFSQPAWSRGEQLMTFSFEEGMNRAQSALIAEGYVNLQKQANIVTGYKGDNTAIIMVNNAPENKQWINIVVASLTNDASIPGAERVKLQRQIENNNSSTQTNNSNNSTKNIDWNTSPLSLGLRGKNYTKFSFICPTMDYLGHRLYGTDIYTDDSCICTAGVHTGAISTSGGNLTIEILPAQNSFNSSSRNGANSSNWGDWPGSFRVVR